MNLSDVGETVVLGNRIEWTIKDFFSQKPKENYIWSKYFCFKSEEFYFLLKTPTRSWLGVGLYHHSSDGDFSKYSVRFSIRKRNGEATESSDADYDATVRYFRNKHFTSEEFMQWDTLEEKKDELVPDGHLTIICHVLEEGEEPARKKSQLDKGTQVSLNQLKCEAAVQTIEDAAISSITSEFKDLVSFRDGFKAMYHSDELCDFDIKVKDRVFRTHKVVLAARSSAFASMLRHDMKEKRTGMVEIDDCDSETFEAFLKFLYGEKNGVITPENVVSLYEVANKYYVQNLKVECHRFMMENLSTQLFCDVVCLATKHEERELIKRATEYFKQNKKNIFLSVQWQIFLKEYFTYANELLIKTCD